MCVSWVYISIITKEKQYFNPRGRLYKNKHFPFDGSGLHSVAFGSQRLNIKLCDSTQPSHILHTLSYTYPIDHRMYHFPERAQLRAQRNVSLLNTITYVSPLLTRSACPWPGHEQPGTLLNHIC